MEWIKVQDRLPEEGKIVHIWNKLSGLKMSRFSRRNYTYGYDEEEPWFWRGGSKKYSKDNITHWAPILITRPDAPS